LPIWFIHRVKNNKSTHFDVSCDETPNFAFPHYLNVIVACMSPQQAFHREKGQFVYVFILSLYVQCIQECFIHCLPSILLSALSSKEIYK